ncbi:MAG: hypothetical protein WAN86_26150 [Hyphomicrobiaceae bacterium]
MGRLDRKEPKLNEVKAVLQRLQGFPEDENPAQQPPVHARPRRSGAIVAIIILAPVVAILGAVYLFTSLITSDSRQTTVPSVERSPVNSEGVKAALEVGRALMAKGQVHAARQQLIALARDGSPDAAWDVARSYDPNVLATIPQPDAAPDTAEATRWYRAWYASAVKEGMVATSVSIERIIGAMQTSAQR